jgi:hypothetical protein
MADALHKLVPLLGTSYAVEAEEEPEEQNEPCNNGKSIQVVNLFGNVRTSTKMSTSFPSFSLDHDDYQYNRSKCYSKEEVQMQASALLSRPISLESEAIQDVLQRIPRIMLENVYSSFDVLVDARLNVYSKVLRSHGWSLAQCNDGMEDDACSGVKAVEYKLKTLLEIGTSIYADSVETKFSVETDAVAKTTKLDEGGIEIQLPICMETFVHALHIPSTTDSSHAASLPLCFRTTGSVSG